MEQVTYDAEGDVLYVRLQEGEPVRQTFLGDLRIIDHSGDGSVLGVEFVGASEGVDLSDVPSARTVEQLIQASGLEIKILAG